ncbi:MAG: chemotaxis protein CheB [Bacteroidetes bacterium]|nr:chemotaxis protein CheB [Bacteroidota bacterium]
MNTSKPEFIVAIGGSAGYLLPLFKFFDHTLIDKVSYIILRHINPDAQSHLHRILQSHSKLEVIEAADHMPVENNKVYVLPPGYYLTIKHGILHLQKRSDKINCAIDVFMESLADDFKARSIGIILSGLGKNGLKGVASIKEAGGMVLVQDPTSCEANILPLKIIDSGNFDYVLLPEEMPREILEHVANHLKKTSSGTPLKSNSA